MKGWLKGKTPIHSSASKSLTALDEPQALREALAAAAHILNDDVDRAEEELSKGTSPFHKVWSDQPTAPSQQPKEHSYAFRGAIPLTSWRRDWQHLGLYTRRT